MGAHTQGRGLARNPGLGNSNTYRVAAAHVVFVMEGIMFVCMDVGISAGAHPSISHRHVRMTTASPTVQKAAYGRKISPAVAGKKTAAYGGNCPSSLWGFFVPRGGQRGAPYIYNKVEWGGWG